MQKFTLKNEIFHSRKKNKNIIFNSFSLTIIRQQKQNIEVIVNGNNVSVNLENYNFSLYYEMKNRTSVFKTKVLAAAAIK